MHKCLPHPSQRTERRISAAASLSLCALTVLAQIATTLLLTHALREYATYVYFFLELAAAILAIRVYLRPGSPSYRLVWMCLLLALPVSGMILFCLWGGTHQAKQLSLKKIPPLPVRESVQRNSENNIVQLRRQSPAWGRLASYLNKKGFALYRDTSAEYFDEGSKYFDDLIAHLQQAQVYIFLEYYILAEGEIWDRIFAVLKERAAAGVEIYIIFDDFGNLIRFKDETLQAAQDAGIEMAVFNPVHRYVNRIYFNYRDHRKIAVIDGEHAYTGGINVGDEYANLFPRFGHWKDSGIRLDGEGAWGFARQFIRMWKMVGHTLPNEDDYYRPRNLHSTAPGFCQPFTDGPLNNPEDPIEETYLQLIASAQRMLYLTTPYYAVEEDMQRALCIAADAGVDVRLLVPAVPDKKYAYMVAETYWGELMEHGVKIYKYTPGFLHAKSVLVDREVALVGSTNMDYRTFQLHYECGVLLYHMPVVEELLADMDAIMAQSSLYTLEEWYARPWLRKVTASILKLGAIWL